MGLMKGLGLLDDHLPEGIAYVFRGFGYTAKSMQRFFIEVDGNWIQLIFQLIDVLAQLPLHPVGVPFLLVQTTHTLQNQFGLGAF